MHLIKGLLNPEQNGLKGVFCAELLNPNQNKARDASLASISIQTGEEVRALQVSGWEAL